MVADALSRKSIGNLASLITQQQDILRDLQKIDMHIIAKDVGTGLLAQLTVRPTLTERIRVAQAEDPHLLQVLQQVRDSGKKGFCLDRVGTLKFGDIFCVLDMGRFRREILEEAHQTSYSVHPGETKMYHDVRRYFWWSGLKKRIAEFVARCLIYLHIKIEHQRSAGTLRPLPIPEWKWEHITVDFVVGLPKTLKKKDSIWVAQSQEKSYVDRQRRDLEFLVGDKVFLKVSPWKWVFRFGKKGKLSPRYIGPYEILARIGPVAYQVELPSELSQIHNMFHVSVLRKYLYGPSHVLREKPIQLRNDLSYEEQPVQIIDRCVKTLRRRVVPLVKVLWRHHGVEEATWELEEEMQSTYPHLFIDSGA
ncbi:uncharacterized protein [Typha angustifolia]|uniref:uncharacterized protein n=1 Tax=Typha angustifolia TaxID=59011 RepID=UPI003C2DF898